jgi:hypothetical protein
MTTDKTKEGRSSASLIKETLYCKEWRFNTYYADKLTNNKIAVSIDENYIRTFDTFIEAVNYIDSHCK